MSDVRVIPGPTPTPYIKDGATDLPRSERRVFFVHGIHTGDPMDSVGRFAHYYGRAGFATAIVDYGWTFFAFARLFVNPDVVDTLAQVVRPQDILVGHSNGACIIWELAHRGVPFEGAVLVNPALNKRANFPDTVRWVHVHHNSEDSAVALARLMLKHPWGSMGRDGYVGTDPKVTNYNGDVLLPPLEGHNAYIAAYRRTAPEQIAQVLRELRRRV